MHRKPFLVLISFCSLSLIMITVFLALGGLYTIIPGPGGVPFRMNRLTGKTWRMDFNEGAWLQIHEKPDLSSTQRLPECTGVLAKTLSRKSFTPGIAILASSYHCGDMLTLHAIVNNPDYLKLPPIEQQAIREAFLQQVILPEPEFQRRTSQEKEEVIRRVRSGELPARSVSREAGL